MIAFNDKIYFDRSPDATSIISHEMEIFKENQSVAFNEYIRQRVKFLEGLKNSEHSISYLKTFKPVIGVFAGSFNPFHKGHYNVLLKAEKIFDKVIVAFGKNPEKQDHAFNLPNTLKNRQVETYDGLLTDFIQSLGHDAVVIRGLRNSTDFQYEQNQYRYIQELMPDIKIVSIFCDKEFEHISSSGIRTLQKFGRHQNYLLD